LLGSLTIEDILSIILKKWLVVVLSCVISGVLAYTYTTFFVSPVYISKGTLYVNNKNANTSNPSAGSNVNASDLSVALKLVDTYSVILKSDRFMKIVAEKIDLPRKYDYSQIKSMVSLKGINETEVLQVNVSAKDPTDAKVIAQVLLENSKNEIIRVVEAGSVKIIDDASEPSAPSSPNKKNNAIIGLALGFLGSIGILLLLEILDISVKDEQDLEFHYGIPVVGSIPNLDSLEVPVVNVEGKGVVSDV